MAYDSTWLSPSPTQGNGTGSVVVSALSDRTGRNPRSTVLSFSGQGVGGDPITRTVTQAGKPGFVSINNESYTVAQSGGSVQISGKSNSSKLTFSLLQSGYTLPLTLPATYIAKSLTTNNGAAIANDPGATEEYDFSITITGIDPNTGITQLSNKLTVTPETGQGSAAECYIYQTASAPSLVVGQPSGELPWNAASSTPAVTISIAVTSNTQWTVV